MLDPGPPEFLTVTEIEVVNVTDLNLLSDLLEVEVHLYDANTGQFLGCSGAESGLDAVDQSDTPYFVNGYFQQPFDDLARVTVDELFFSADSQSKCNTPACRLL